MRRSWFIILLACAIAVTALLVARIPPGERTLDHGSGAPAHPSATGGDQGVDGSIGTPIATLPFKGDALPVLVELTGHVRDTSGSSVAHARIEVRDECGSGSRCAEGTSAEDGFFRIGITEPGDFYALALANGFEAGRSGPVHADEGDDRRPVAVEMVLCRRGAALRGRVTDPRGEPIQGAIVRAGSKRDLDLDTFLDAAPLDLRGVTDVDGKFTVQCVPLGLTPVSASAVGLARWHEVVDARADGAPIDIRMAAGAIVEGVVRDERGTPVSRAWVATRDLLCSATTDENGSYRLEGLPSGRLELIASIELANGHDVRATATVVAAESGGTCRWDPVLPEGRDLRVFLVDGENRPIGALLVIAWVERGLVDARPGHRDFWSLEKYSGRSPLTATWAETNSDGRAVLDGCADLGYSLTVRDPARRWIDIAWGPVVESPFEDVIIKLDRATLPSASITGTLADGTCRDRALVVRSIERKECEVVAWRDDGSFHVGPLPPGCYSIEHCERHLEPLRKQLAAGETWDVGAISLGPPSGAIIEISGSAEGVPRKERGEWIAFREDGNIQNCSVMQFGRGWAALAPGRYEIQLCQSGLAVQRRTVVIEPGRTARVVFGTPAGCECLFQVDARAFEDASLTIDVCDPGGRAVLSAIATVRTGSCQLFACLPPGSYRVAASTAGGGGACLSTGSLDLIVPGPEGPAQVVRLAFERTADPDAGARDGDTHR